MTKSNEELFQEWAERAQQVSKMVLEKGDTPFDPYAVQIGHIAILWNNIHERLCDLFYGISGLGVLTDTKYCNIANVIWREFRSDRAAREMLRAVTPLALEKRPKAIANIDWLLKTIGKLADSRDIAAHVPLMMFTSTDASREHETTLAVDVDWTRFNRQSEKLKNVPDFERWLTDLRITLKGLQTYTNQLLARLNDVSEHSPWPDRPPMPHLGQKATPAKPHQRKGQQ